MFYPIDLEIHGVSKEAVIGIDDNGCLDTLSAIVGLEVVDLSDLLNCPDIYNSIEHDYLALIANIEV